MIYSIYGTLELIEPYHIVIENNGIGYSIKTTLTTISRIGKIDEKVKVMTYLHVKEDSMELFGFYSINELDTFKLLISISGVGPKAAISILSDLSPENFAICIANSDAKTLTKSNGIGLKTAQRIVLELQDKMKKENISKVFINDNSESSLNNGNGSEAIAALEILGYQRSIASQIISKVDSNTSVEDMIKYALKELSGKV